MSPKHSSVIKKRRAIVGMLTPTDAELFSAHYLTGDFVDSSPNVVTLCISELISQGATIVCSEYPLADRDHDEDIEMDDDDDSEATPPRPLLSQQPSSDREVCTYYRKRRASLLSPHLHIQSPSHADETRSSPTHCADPSAPDLTVPQKRYEVRIKRLEDRLTVIQKEVTDGFVQIKDMLRNGQEYMLLRMKQMIEDATKARDSVHTYFFDGREMFERETIIEEADDVGAETIGIGMTDWTSGRMVDDVGTDTIGMTEGTSGRTVDDVGAETIGIGTTEGTSGRTVDDVGAETIDIGTTEGTSGRTVDDVAATLEVRTKMLNDSVFSTITALSLEQSIIGVVERTWPQIKIDIDHATETSRKFGLVVPYNKRWFLDLMTPGIWLEEVHLQECLRGLLELQKNYPYLMSNTVSLMDIYFHQIVSYAFNEGGPSNIGSLVTYAKSELSSWPTVPWDKANLI